MSDKEAIKKLEFMRDAYQKLIDENIDEGRVVGTDITGTWKAETPLNDAYRLQIEALEMAINALKEHTGCAGCKYQKKVSNICFDCSRPIMDRFEPIGDET